VRDGDLCDPKGEEPRMRSALGARRFPPQLTTDFQRPLCPKLSVLSSTVHSHGHHRGVVFCALGLRMFDTRP